MTDDENMESWREFLRLDPQIEWDGLTPEFKTTHLPRLLPLLTGWEDTRLAAELSAAGGWDAVARKLIACRSRRDEQLRERWLRLSIRIACLLLGDRHVEVARLRLSLACLLSLLSPQSQPTVEGREHVMLALPILETLPPADPDLKDAYHFMGGQSATLDERMHWIRMQIARQERAHGPADPGVALNKWDLAECFDEMGKYDEALALYEQAVEVYRQKMINEQQTNDMVFVRVLAARCQKVGNLEAAGKYQQMEMELKIDLELQKQFAAQPQSGPSRVMTAKEIDDLLGFKD